ncbi:metallophosphoesterase family protein [Planctomycetota bacterium]
MRYGLVSDIHANLLAWKAVWSDIHALGIDEIICLGDIIGYGPRPAETLAEVYANVHHIILGNHDAVIAGIYDPSSFNPDAKRMIEWTNSQLDKKAAEVFSGFPLEMVLEAGDFKALCVHGAAHQPEGFPYILEEEDARKTWAASDHPLIFVGHTHRPRIDMLDADGTYHAPALQDFLIEEGCRYIVNVGSVGMPRAKDFRACYVVFDTDERSITYHHAAYDMEALEKDVKERIGETKQALRLLASFDELKGGRVREQMDFTPSIEKVKEATRKAATRHRRRVVRSSPWDWLRGGPAQKPEEGKDETGRGGKRAPTSRSRRPSTGKMALRFISDAASGITGSAKPLISSIGRMRSSPSRPQRKRSRNKSGEVIWLSRDATYEASSVHKRFSEHPDELLMVQDLEEDRGYAYAFRAERERMPSRLVVTLPYSAVLKRIVAVFKDRIPEDLRIRISRDAKSWVDLYKGPGEYGVWDIPVEEEARMKHVWIGLTTAGEFRPYAVQVFGIE